MTGTKTKTMHRTRPYDGQSHTDQGERGKTEVKGLTMRDLCDCFVRGMMSASGHVVPEKYDEAQKGEGAALDYNDMYGWDSTQTSPGAIMQNMICEVEKMMGIFPNIHTADRVAEVKSSAAAWEETAARYARNAEYYRGLVVRIGKLVGAAAHTADDGTLSNDVLCAKVPDLVEKALEPTTSK